MKQGATLFGSTSLGPRSKRLKWLASTIWANGLEFACDLLGGAARDSVPYGAYLFLLEGAGGELGFAKDNNAQGWAAARQSEAMDVDGIVGQAKAMSEAFDFDQLNLREASSTRR